VRNTPRTVGKTMITDMSNIETIAIIKPVEDLYQGEDLILDK